MFNLSIYSPDYATINCFEFPPSKEILISFIIIFLICCVIAILINYIRIYEGFNPK